MSSAEVSSRDPSHRDPIVSGVSCVVVHHRSLAVLPKTLESIQSQGVEPNRIVVVDNSGSTIADSALESAIGPTVALERIENLGYGDAANHGVRFLLEGAHPPEFILVATHEVRPDEGAVGLLVEAIASDDKRIVVGPRLLSDLPNGSVRSACGGVRTRRLGIPVHRACSDDDGGVVDCDWLDGAFALYRSSFLRENPFRTEFFLYYEESELHLRLSARPGAVACVTESAVREAASGVPPFLRGRNLQWLLQCHGTWSQRLLALPWVLFKLTVKVLMGRSTKDDLRQTTKGWWFALRHPLDR